MPHRLPLGSQRARLISLVALCLFTRRAAGQDASSAHSCTMDDESDPDAGAPPEDSGLLYASFVVNKEPFTIALSDPAAKANALALWHGQSTTGIPVGRLICDAAEYNSPWQFYLDPATVHFAQSTTEVCDGTPSYVSAHCATFSNGTYCPWGSQLVALRECADADMPVEDCPLVP